MKKNLVHNETILVNPKKWFWQKIIITFALVGIIAIVTTTTIFVNANKNHTKAKGLTQEIIYSNLSEKGFKNLVSDYNKINNNPIKSIMTKQNIIYIPNTLYQKVSSDMFLSLTDSDSFELTNRVLQSIEGNFRMIGLMNNTIFNRQAIQPWRWPDYERKNRNNLEIKIENVKLQYKGFDEYLSVTCIFKSAKTAKYDLNPIQEWTEQTVNYLFSQAQLINTDLNMRSGGFFAGLTFEGLKNVDGSWKGDQKVSIRDFNNKIYDWMLTCFKRANLISSDFNLNYVNQFEFDGWSEIYAKDKKGIHQDEEYIYLSESNDLGALSIVSKIHVNWKTLNPEKTVFTLDGSYLDFAYHEKWNNGK